MRHLTLLVDMDDTIEDLTTPWVNSLNQTHGTSVQKKDINDWNLSIAFPSLSKDQIFAPISTAELWKRVTPLPGAPEYLKKLIDDGHKVVIVTASSHESISFKLKYVLFEYFPYLSMKDVIVASQKQLIKGDVMVDDAPHNLEGGEYFKILITAPHNRKYNASENGMVRADHWSDIYNIISEYARKE